MDPKSLPGGPAFPISIPGCGDNGAHGMSLRDYFAAAAIPGLVVAKASGGNWVTEELAEEAYWLADAMLKARGDAQ